MKEFIGHFVRFQKEIGKRIGSNSFLGYRNRTFVEKCYKQRIEYDEGIGFCLGLSSIGPFYRVYIFDMEESDRLFLVEEKDIMEVGRKMSVEECLTSEIERIREFGQFLLSESKSA